MFGTTKLFLDYFGLKKLDDLPPLADLSDWESLRVQLNLPAVDGDESIDELEGMSNELPDLLTEDDDDPEDGDSVAVADAEEVIDIDRALAEEDDVEPIEAVAWPDPTASQVASLDLAPTGSNDGLDDDSEEDAGASSTGT